MQYQNRRLTWPTQIVIQEADILFDIRKKYLYLGLLTSCKSIREGFNKTNAYGIH